MCEVFLWLVPVFIPLENYTLSWQLTIVPHFQWGYLLLWTSQLDMTPHLQHECTSYRRGDWWRQCWWCVHAYGNFYCSLRGSVRAHHGLFRTRAFETPATFHKVAKSHWTEQWFIQVNQKTSPSPLFINIAVTPSIGMVCKCILIGFLHFLDWQGHSTWVVTAQEKANFDMIFKTLDTNNDGLVSGEEVRPTLVQSGLQQGVLAHIW